MVTVYFSTLMAYVPLNYWISIQFLDMNGVLLVDAMELRNAEQSLLIYEVSRYAKQSSWRRASFG